MHHVDSPASVIAEMFRVARKAVLISDHNNFAFGKQWLDGYVSSFTAVVFLASPRSLNKDSVAKDIRKTTGGGILTRF